ncbi:MAG: hypothetical protein DMG17_29170 [Acidobacteria bacterium]|nr:MAG: hypothetical protein DMG18_02905 [Acidobacteriota bacterium]PYS08343.1 MAG: hypothetical protein DMG17_29170 [Acidobacteriota bacterium]
MKSGGRRFRVLGIACYIRQRMRHSPLEGFGSILGNGKEAHTKRSAPEISAGAYEVNRQWAGTTVE